MDRTDIDDEDDFDDDDPEDGVTALLRRVEVLESKIEGFEDDLRRMVWGLPAILILLALVLWWLDGQ